MATTTIGAVAKLTVEVYVDAENLYKAEQALDDFLASAENDDRLVSFRVTASDWVPEIWVPKESAT